MVEVSGGGGWWRWVVEVSDGSGWWKWVADVSGGGERIEVPVVASAILLAFRYLSYDISDLILGSGLSPAITTQQQHSIDICLR